MRVKKGDLAIIISACSDFSDWIGRIVSVVGRSTFHPDSWIVEFQGARPQSVPHYSLSCSVNDAALRPISGLPDTEETNTHAPTDCEYWIGA